jgi:hypothetical protein
MSKAKKQAYAEKQKSAAQATAAREMTPLGENPQPAAPAPKAKSRKQSRGK